MDQEAQNLAADRNYKQGLELMKAGKYDEAFKTFEGILTVHEHPEVYYNMGYIKSAKGQFEEALYYFRQATRIDTNFARAYKMMAEVYYKLGKNEEAGQYFQRAADIYMDRNEDNSAEEILETVLKLWPDTTNVFNSLGIIYRRQGRLDDAEEQYRKALLVHPTDENIYFNLSRIHMAKNDFKSANKALQKAIELNPGFSQARELMKAVEIRVRL
jgi:tetratricopeptide (TPR) repeat protein